MPKLTPEQKERQREALRRYYANRTPEEKAALVEKRYAAYRRSRILKNPPKRGRLTGFGMLFEDDDLI